LIIDAITAYFTCHSDIIIDADYFRCRHYCHYYALLPLYLIYMPVSPILRVYAADYFLAPFSRH